jgi:hypothetical protein
MLLVSIQTLSNSACSLFPVPTNLSPILNPLSPIPYRDTSDPYSADPDVPPLLRQLSRQPVNAEPPGPLLGHSWLTPDAVWFVRNHHPVPAPAPAAPGASPDSAYTVAVRIGGGEAVCISLQDIKTLFTKHEVVATLQVGHFPAPPRPTLPVDVKCFSALTYTSLCRLISAGATAGRR